MWVRRALINIGLRSLLLCVVAVLGGCAVAHDGGKGRDADLARVEIFPGAPTGSYEDENAGIFSTEERCDTAVHIYAEFLRTWFGADEVRGYFAGTDAGEYLCSQKRSASSELHFLHRLCARACLDLEHNNTSAAHQRVIRALELSPDFAPAQLLEAEVAAAQGNVAGALARIEQIYSENPHLNRLHLRMNALHMELQDYPRAEQDLRRYLYVKPDAQPVLLQLGRIQAEQEDFTEATKTFQTLIDLAPQESLAYFELGRVLEQRQEEKRALDLYRSAAQTLDRNVQEFEYLQAKLLLELHENASAADVLRSSLEREDSPQLRLLYGYALFELEQYAEAVPQLRTAAEALEFNPMAWLYLGKALAALEQWYDAIAAFQQVDAGEGRTEALIHLAGLYHLVDFNRDAISVLNELLDLEISAPILYQHLSYLHTLEGARQAAVATLEQGIEQYPASAELKYRLGLLQAMLGDYSAALEYMEQVLPEYPDDIELLNNIAYLYAETEQKLESAALLARKALNQEERPEFHDTLGWVYFKQQRFALALKHLRLAHEMSPRDPHILNHLGDVYSVIGQKAQAAEAYRKSEILSRNNNDLSK